MIFFKIYDKSKTIRMDLYSNLLINTINYTKNSTKVRKMLIFASLPNLLLSIKFNFSHIGFTFQSF